MRVLYRVERRPRGGRSGAGQLDQQSFSLEKAVNPLMSQISTDETKDLCKVLVHCLCDTQAADVRSLICAHLRNLRIELRFLGSGGHTQHKRGVAEQCDTEQYVHQLWVSSR
jgi:hypothetical protein